MNVVCSTRATCRPWTDGGVAQALHNARAGCRFPGISKAHQAPLPRSPACLPQEDRPSPDARMVTMAREVRETSQHSRLKAHHLRYHWIAREHGGFYRTTLRAIHFRGIFTVQDSIYRIFLLRSAMPCIARETDQLCVPTDAWRRPYMRQPAHGAGEFPSHDFFTQPFLKCTVETRKPRLGVHLELPTYQFVPLYEYIH
jgi:hypothetical protein